MRFVAVALILLILFYVLTRSLSSTWYIPLYCLFSATGLGYGYWEWRQLGRRHRTLQRDLDARQGDLRASLFSSHEEE